MVNFSPCTSTVWYRYLMIIKFTPYSDTKIVSEKNLPLASVRREKKEAIFL